MQAILQQLISNLESAESTATKIIPWASPIPTFGDSQKSKVATLGLNPSNREFVDIKGEELCGNQRRFHTLSSLDINHWKNVSDSHLYKISETCRNYFLNNPYDSWFKALDNLIYSSGASYYRSKPLQACHLDLIPYATSCKWTELNNKQKNSLMILSHDALALLLQDSPIQLLILNGKSVINYFQILSGLRLDSTEISEWALPRKNTDDVKGYGFTGEIDSLAGIRLKRRITVIGFNHNLQSSFGVTRQVKKSIQKWVSKQAEGVIK